MTVISNLISIQIRLCHCYERISDQFRFCCQICLKKTLDLGIANIELLIYKGSGEFFHKGSYSKYFRFFTLYCLCLKYHTRQFGH